MSITPAGDTVNYLGSDGVTVKEAVAVAIVAGGGGGEGGGGDGLTNEQLRASAVPVSGPVTDTQLKVSTGATNVAPYADPTGVAAGTIIGVPKGIYVQNAEIIALLTSIDNKTVAPE